MKIELQHITKDYGGVRAVDDVSLSIQAGEVHGIVGQNGAGKSTLIKILSGLVTDYRGTISIDGQTVRFTSPRDSENHGIRAVYQELSNIDSLSVAENIHLGNHLVGNFGLIRWADMKRTAQSALETLGLDHLHVDHPLGSYPLGIRQLVEIARVLASGADIIILDEPTSALSEAETGKLLSIIRSLPKQGKTVLLISQKLDDVLLAADRVTVIRDGKLALSRNISGLGKGDIIGSMLGTGHDSNLAEPNPCVVLQPYSGTSAARLEVTNISCKGAFDGLSFQVFPGQCLALYGLMGAGHVEVGEALYGLRRLASGSVVLDGKQLRLDDPVRAKAKGIGYLHEDRKRCLHMAFPISQNISLPFLRQIHNTALWNNPRREVAVAQDARERFLIKASSLEATLEELSGGNQQKTSISRWLTEASDLKLLILQEPTRGVDVGAKAEIISVLKQFKERGLALLLITHEPETALSLGDKIVVMARGRESKAFAGQTVCKAQLLEVQ